MRIAILYHDTAYRSTARPGERGTAEAIEAVYVALRDLGHVPLRVPLDSPLADWTGRLGEADVALVFNLCDAVARAAGNEARITAAIELLGLPVTGSSSATLALAQREDHVIAILGAAGLPVPAWLPIPTGERLLGWQCFPAIVKPGAEDVSAGIAREWIAADGAAGAVGGARWHGPAIVRKFLGGRKLIVGIVGNDTLPVAEIDVGSLPTESWPRVTGAALWDTGATAEVGTVVRCPAALDEPTREEAVRLARAAWRLVGGRGYGHVGLRQDPAGRLHVLAVEPNPTLAPSADLGRIAAANGWGYSELIGRIVREGVKCAQ